MRNEISAILLAAGSGKRLKHKTPKTFIKLKGKEVFRYSLDKFHPIKQIKRIIMTVPDNFTPEQLAKLGRKLKSYRKLTIIKGGFERVDSVKKALYSLPAGTTHVIIHDCARPLVQMRTIVRSLNLALRKGNCVVGRILTESIKKYKNGLLTANLDRNMVFIAETPQIFKLEEIKSIYFSQKKINGVTDDSYILINNRKKVHFMISDGANFKLTNLSDLELIKKLI